MVQIFKISDFPSVGINLLSDLIPLVRLLTYFFLFQEVFFRFPIFPSPSKNLSHIALSLF